MKTNEVKMVIYNHLQSLIKEWFEDKPLIQAVAKTIIQANINKFDSLLYMLTNEDGDLMIDELVDNLGDMVEKGYQLDLTTISPLLPNRVLLISKDDIKSIINTIKRG